MELDKKIKVVLQKINRHGRENIVAALVLNIFIGIGFFVVLWLLRSYSIDFCLRTLEQKAQEAQRDIYLQFSSIQEHMKMLAGIIEEEEDLTSEHVAKILEMNAELEVVSRLGIILEDGRTLYQDGTLSGPAGENVPDTEDGEESLGMNIDLDNFGSENLLLLFNVPLEINGKTEGMLFGVIEPQDLSHYFEVNIFDGNANIFIIDSENAEYVMDTVNNQVEDISESENIQIKKGYSKEQITRDFEDGKGGMTAFFSERDNGYLYTAYEPVGFRDWYVLVTVPESTVFKETEYIGKVLFWLGLYELAILLVYFVWDIIHTRKEVRAKEKMATTDLLTNLKNRNAYEQTLAKYVQNFPASLACVYADANGLHELNNNYGHAAGDQMLQTVASAFVELFGDEHVYRIGGDEFLVFTESDLSSVQKKAASAKEKASKSGYHVSVGAASAKEKADVSAVIKTAEERMYEDKKQYYLEHGDRRKMR